ncbi:hypothetical protein MMC30_002334 [Trapelia coarctata]|nr:hypothetical protein [Trapelia coarctata]
MLPKISTRRTLSSRSSISSDSSDGSPTRSINSFLDTPPLSPALPSIVPRHGKKPPPRRLRTSLRFLKRVLPWVVGVAAAVGLLWMVVHSARTRYNIRNYSPNNAGARVVGGDELPDEPTPVVLVDLRGRTKWTVYIPENLAFPLAPHVYAELCSETEDIAAPLSDCKDRTGAKARKACSSYYHVDNSFVDAKEAQDRGLIPKPKGSSKDLAGKLIGKETVRPKGRYSKGEDLNQTKGSDAGAVCEKSLTYVLESNDPGLGNTLMGLWMAYGLALKEHRAFFIDDRRWAYGKYATYFRPPPTPSCRPPPETYRLPCPHHARHLLVSAATFKWTFGPAFDVAFPQKKTFALLRAGYEALFHLADPDAVYLAKRIEKLNTEVRAHGGAIVGVHVRHGDQHPWEYQYQHSYTPLEKYVDVAKALIAQFATSKNGTTDTGKVGESRIVLASDDPDVYPSTELSFALHAQDQIVMASKKQLDAAQKTLRNPSVYHKFTDENTGWEGGFFRSVFWGLGKPAKSARSLQVPASINSAAVRGYAPPNELALQLRGLIIRAYLLDLGVLAGSEGVVCGVSSSSCRLLAVMMGWENAMAKRRWRNVDGSFAWRGLKLGPEQGL